MFWEIILVKLEENSLKNTSEEVYFSVQLQEQVSEKGWNELHKQVTS